MLQYPVGSLGKELIKNQDGKLIIQALDYNRIADIVANRLNFEVNKWPDDTIDRVFNTKIARDADLDLAIVNDISMRACGNESAFSICKGDPEKALGKLTAHKA